MLGLWRENEWECVCLREKEEEGWGVECQNRWCLTLIVGWEVGVTDNLKFM